MVLDKEFLVKAFSDKTTRCCITVLKDRGGLVDDENVEVSISAVYDCSTRQMDYSKLEICVDTPKYFHDKETDENFIEDINRDVSIVSTPLEFIKQVEGLFANGATVYFCLKTSS